jgi:LPS export ABC transporter protein LptC
MTKWGQKKSAHIRGFYLLFPLMGLLLVNCSFDYESAGGDSVKNRPDIIMENIEYVRVRRGNPLARFQAEHAERWEDRQTMELKYFSFEQMEDRGETINAEGRAGAAVIQLGTGDISLRNGVKINVESEDVSIMTAELDWKDKDKVLSGGEFDIVEIERSDGTKFTGRGFTADARNRTWTFSGEVSGSYVEKEDEEKDEEKTEIKITEEWTRERPSHYGVEQFHEPAAQIPEQPAFETEQPGESKPIISEQPQILPEEPLPTFVEDK